MGLPIVVACMMFAGSPTAMVRPQSDGVRSGPIVLHVGESAAIGPGLTLTFGQVRSDSRCPTNARCIRAGEAVVVLVLREEQREPTEIVFDVPPGGGVSGAVESYRFDVVSLEPQSEAGVEIRENEYVVTVRVARISSR